MTSESKPVLSNYTNLLNYTGMRTILDQQLEANRLSGSKQPYLSNQVRNLRKHNVPFWKIEVPMLRLMVEFLPVTDPQLGELDTLTFAASCTYWEQLVVSSQKLPVVTPTELSMA